MTHPQYTTIRRKGRRSVSIVVRPDRTVQILVPSTMNAEAIDTIVVAKQGWINRKLDEFSGSELQHREHLYREGEQFLYMGKQMVLATFTGRGNIRITDGTIRATVPPGLRGEERSFYIKQKLHEFYHAEALKIFREKTAKIAEQSGITPIYVGVKEYKSRWGTCFNDGRIYFNTRLILAPENIMEYVIVHELCHLEVPNHSKLFWRRVETFIPDWKERRKWLRINGHALYL